MKMIPRILLFALLSISFLQLQAQKTETTIILLRHAEKDTVGSDPDLSPAGQLRATSLKTVFKDYAPDEFYTTPYKRTRQTIMGWADQSGKEIKTYDPKSMEAFAAQLKAMKGKTIVVAGHSNTTPMLVNLLLGASKYQPLDDSVYNKAFVVTINNDVASDKMVEYK